MLIGDYMIKMVKNVPQMKVPYDKHGNLLHYPDTNILGGIIWCDNKLITNMNLVLTDHVRGRSSIRFIWLDTNTNCQYPMFAIDMISLIKSGEVIPSGKTSPDISWVVRRRGTCYGLSML